MTKLSPFRRRGIRREAAVLAALFPLVPFAAGQTSFTITTIAGGVPPPTPGPAISLSLGIPEGLAVDTSGNVYFSSQQFPPRIPNPWGPF